MKRKSDKEKQDKKAEVDYEKLGMMLQSIIESGYVERGKLYKTTFIKGVIGGFGGVIGATIVVALLAWVLSLFSQVPFLNRITDNAQNTINKTQTFTP